MRTSPSAFAPGIGRSSSAFTTEKIVALAAMPRPIEIVATMVNAGLRRSPRAA
jgi:hypothetical protein